MSFGEELLEGFGEAIGLEEAGNRAEKKSLLVGIKGYGVWLALLHELRGEKNLARPEREKSWVHCLRTTSFGSTSGHNNEINKYLSLSLTTTTGGLGFKTLRV